MGSHAQMSSQPLLEQTAKTKKNSNICKSVPIGEAS